MAVEERSSGEYPKWEIHYETRQIPRQVLSELRWRIMDEKDSSRCHRRPSSASCTLQERPVGSGPFATVNRRLTGQQPAQAELPHRRHREAEILADTHDIADYWAIDLKPASKLEGG